MAELNREALLIYLNDLRVMETVIYESQKKKNVISHMVNQKHKEYQGYVNCKPKFNFKKPINQSDEPGFRKFFLVHSLLAGLGFLIMGLFSSFAYLPVGAFFMILGIIFLTVRCVVKMQLDRKYEQVYHAEYALQHSKYEGKLEKYNAEEMKRRNLYNNYKKNSDNHISKINNDIRKMQNILNEAYSANIIPNQFRNIQGVYYLYDYLSTSNQTLSEALLQCNLEAIKQKLDKMISLQSAMVVEIAQQNAKTDKIIQQNRELLSSVKEVGVHTANAAESAREAAQYAQISATNSEITRELAEKQLAYQSVEFWLRK